MNRSKPTPALALRLADFKLTGHYCIRINDQFRLCFVWTQQGPQYAEIVDYH